MNSVPVLDTLLRDIRHNSRALWKHPVFTMVALFTLAIGIGANTAVFSVVNRVLLKPLPYPKPGELVAVRQVAPGAAGLANFIDGLLLSGSMYFTYADHNRTFQSIGIWVAGTANVTGLAEPEQVRTVIVSDGVLQALDVAPAAGRWLLPQDQVPRTHEVAILGYGYWQRRFGGDRSVIGRNIQVDSRPREIVGIMPRGFQLVHANFDVMLPLALDRGKQILAGFGYQALARLKPGASIAQANADIARMIPIWMDSWTNGPGTDPHVYQQWRITPTIRPLKDDIVGNVGDVLWAIMATIGLVMLIAGANVTNLLLVRAESRQHELAVRKAIGATRARMIQNLLMESLLLGLMGGALGLVLAAFGLKALVAIGPANLPRLNEISVDPRTLVFAFILSVISGVLFGLLPALKYSGSRVALALRSAGRSASTSRERLRARNILVVAQVAMAMVLLVSAGLMIRTFQALRSIEPGFTHSEQLETMRIAIPRSLVPETARVIRIQNDILDKLSAIPGVTSVGFASELPMEGLGSNSWDGIYAQDKAYADSDIPPLRLFEYVSPGYFRTAGTRMIAGRELTWTDVYGLRPVAIVSENLARELWGSASRALGKRFREFPSMPWHEVIGVVQDVRQNGVHEKTPATVYWPSMMPYMFGPSAPNAWRSMTYAVRSSRTGTQGFIDQVRQAVWSVNSNLPVASVRPMQEIYDRSMARTSFALVMLGIAGAMALLLGIIGIYGVISYAVSQRRIEIGIRLALGAQQTELRRMFVRSGLILVVIGVATGLVAAIGLMRLMKSLLFGISALDPATYVGVSLVLTAAAMLASYLPARRASKVDPLEALRAE